VLLLQLLELTLHIAQALELGDVLGEDAGLLADMATALSLNSKL
jgi:hypothetical protein